MQRNDPDVGLMLALRAGDASAFDALFHRWAGPVLRYLTRIVRDRAVAEELAQETFLRVHRSRSGYSPDARFSTWLYTIATRLALNELRRRVHAGRHESADAGEAPLVARFASAEPAGDAVADARRRVAAVERALARLPERQRAALWLVAVEGLAYQDVASALETTTASVKSLVHRARSALAAGEGGAHDEAPRPAPERGRPASEARAEPGDAAASGRGEWLRAGPEGRSGCAGGGDTDE